MQSELNYKELLPRSTWEIAPDRWPFGYAGKNILVTGAGGSIGSQLVGQILAHCQPKSLTLVDNSEYNLFAIKERTGGLLNTESSSVPLYAYLDNLLDQDRLQQILGEHAIDVVFHTAAYKHVPLLESNIRYAVENNIISNHNLLYAASESNVETFVHISSDKANDPISVMGFTKRINEQYVSWVSQNTKLQAGSVRFGNVIGSAGSVVQIFLEQLAKGNSLTVTDERVLRYFMTDTEAAQFVLAAGHLAKDGELFVLDIGRPVKILELAEKIAGQVADLNPDWTPPSPLVRYVGLRPGEKLIEEPIITGAEIATDLGGVFHLPQERISTEFYDNYLEFIQTWREHPEPEIRKRLASLILVKNPA